MNERPQSNHGAIVRHEAEAIAVSFPPLLVEAERIAHTVAAGMHGRRRAGPGESFWQHRPYAFGDPVSAIDWRQSARIADRLYIRQNEWDAAAAVWIWRDKSRSLDYASLKDQPTKRRRADIIAVALATLLAEGGERIGLAGPERRIFHGRNAAARFYEEFEIDAFDDLASLPVYAHVGAHARIVMISDFFADPEKIADVVAQYASQGIKGVMLQIIDPAEETFPFKGRTEFSDFESRDRLTFGDARSLGEAYRREFAAHREALRNLAGRVQWNFLPHRTDAPASSALMALYIALADQRGRR
ncbi:MAG: DUF58 domain-containing protein [Parvularculaceae bacterium]|nr:DUF58 domain-containing protein [Parvularculaceae bacterium]